MFIWCKTGERLGEPSFIPVFKPHKHKLYILRHCTNIVYVFVNIPTSSPVITCFVNWSDNNFKLRTCWQNN